MSSLFITAHRRVLSLWFPALAAEQALRGIPQFTGGPFAVVREQVNALSIQSVNDDAYAQGLRTGQMLSEARALCPNLTTVPENPVAIDGFLKSLARWAGKFTPWVATRAPASLMLDISGCAHLFGGEQGLIDLVQSDCAALNLTVRHGVADTVGAAWALARFAGADTTSDRNGDAIQQEARATRSRAHKRRNWERGGAAPMLITKANAPRIAAPGETLAALADLPIAALRLEQDVCTKLARLGLRRISDLTPLPRASVARRFGADTLRRLDQALGYEAEPVCPADPPRNYATRISFPDPIGLPDDIEAAITRLLPPLCEKLCRAGMGARKVQLTLTRTDGGLQIVEAGLARPAHDPARIEPLLTLQLPKIEPEFGIDIMRLEAVVTEPLFPEQHKGHAAAIDAAKSRRDTSTAHADLLGRLGARMGLEALTILHPVASHIPEKSQSRQSAAHTDAGTDWPIPTTPRPVLNFAPEPVVSKGGKRPPDTFTWRRRTLRTHSAIGPERIAPEWWLDDPAWRTGARDYWVITTETGERLWLFQALGGAINGGWFCTGDFL